MARSPKGLTCMGASHPAFLRIGDGCIVFYMRFLIFGGATGMAHLFLFPANLPLASPRPSPWERVHCFLFVFPDKSRGLVVPHLHCSGSSAREILNCL
jgi:hypothetical protein